MTVDGRCAARHTKAVDQIVLQRQQTQIGLIFNQRQRSQTSTIQINAIRKFVFVFGTTLYAPEAMLHHIGTVADAAIGLFVGVVVVRLEVGHLLDVTRTQCAVRSMYRTIVNVAVQARRDWFNSQR